MGRGHSGAFTLSPYISARSIRGMTEVNIGVLSGLSLDCLGADIFNDPADFDQIPPRRRLSRAHWFFPCTPGQAYLEFLGGVYCPSSL